MKPYPVEPRFARVAAAIGDPTRATMLSRLLDGRYYTATELANHAGIASSTASQHLKLLTDEKLLSVRAQGRHRYFTLADGNVAAALEGLLLVADNASPRARLWEAKQMQGLRYARSCYGHLAGELGVMFKDCCVRRGWIHVVANSNAEYGLNSEGKTAFTRMGVPAPILSQSHRGRSLYGCVDWSHRREHLAGSLARELLNALVEKAWLTRKKTSRELLLTTKGKVEFVDFLSNE